jgi:hypothetical protein
MTVGVEDDLPPDVKRVLVLTAERNPGLLNVRLTAALPVTYRGFAAHSLPLAVNSCYPQSPSSQVHSSSVKSSSARVIGWQQRGHSSSLPSALCSMGKQSSQSSHHHNPTIAPSFCG